MIQIKEIGFSNMFSYGEDNVFRIQPSVTQLVGANGCGKSSIASVLEELFYNKNSRGIKKADIANRYSGVKGYSCYADFSIDGINYRIDKVVKAASKVTLTREGEDISGHTATQTYKHLEALLRMDFSTFTKLVYQSMVSSLDFLSATDANRKKFLISLLGLENYVDAENALKEALKESKNEVAKATGSVDTISRWVKQNGNVPETVALQQVPEHDPGSERILAERKHTLANLERHNKDVAKNLSNLRALDSLAEVQPSLPPEIPVKELTAYLNTAKSNLRVITSQQDALKKELLKVKDIKENCHVCNSPLDVGNKADMLAKATEDLESIQPEVDRANTEVISMTESLRLATLEQAAYDKYVRYTTNLETLQAKIDPTAPTELETTATVEKAIKDLETKIARTDAEIASVTAFNTRAIENNATVDATKAQISKFTEDLETSKATLAELSVTHGKVDLLTKSLGTKGLIAYKVESVVKVFETLINSYLQVFSDGDFALTFSVEDTKLSLNIYNKGEACDIKSLSSGEFNRVNTATLLAVRKMMTSISKIDLNLLILDEVVSVLDQEGKDTLISVLLKEPNLSSIVVSHGYEHPLATKVTVVKQNNISRLDDE